MEYIYLRAPRMHGDHVVALEPKVLQQFVRFCCELGLDQLIDTEVTEARERAARAKAVPA